MLHKYRAVRALFHGAVCTAALSSPSLLAGDGFYPRNGMFHFVNGRVTVRQDESATPSQPVQPSQPVDSSSSSNSDAPSGGGLAESAQASAAGVDRPATSFESTPVSATIAPERTAVLESAPSADFVSGAESDVRATSDGGSLIAESPNVTGTSFQRRPVSNRPFVRGFRDGQIATQADGAYFFAARNDLDTMLSKIDAGIIEDVIIIKGPYSAQYGPGFSFIDVVTADTPRFEEGLAFTGRSSMMFESNGGRWATRSVLGGGGEDYGFRVSYGERHGSNYLSGNGLRLEGDYDISDINLQLGYNIDECNRLEVRATRLDERDVGYQGQVFSIDDLGTNAYSMRFRSEEGCYYDRWIVDAWYNETDAHASGGVPDFFGLGPNVFGFDGVSDFRNSSAGYRTGMTWGDDDGFQLTLGTDLRANQLRLDEIDTFTLLGVVGAPTNFPIPDSQQIDAGVYAEFKVPVTEWMRVRAGGRIDAVDSRAAQTVPARPPAPAINFINADENDQLLISTFMTGEIDLTDEWTAHAGLGYAERAPTLTELYAFNPYIATIQQGDTFLLGNPSLDEEQLFQIDIGLTAEYNDFRGGIHAFYGWVDDYITYQATPFLAGRRLLFRNTDEATIAGFEFTGDLKMTDWLDVFGNMAFVEGRDQAINEPLPSIYPFQSRAGFRIHQASDNPYWGVEFGARMVGAQNRVAQSLGEFRTPGFVVLDLRSYCRLTENLTWTGGVENLTDHNYLEHFDLRSIFANPAFQPGVSFYSGLEARY